MAGTALDRARPHSITLKSERGSSRPRVNVCVRRCEPSASTPHIVASAVHRHGAAHRGAARGLRALRRRVHGMGVVVHGARLSNCSIANKSAAQLESASSYTRQRITTDRPRHAAPRRFVKKLRAAIFTIVRPTDRPAMMLDEALPSLFRSFSLCTSETSLRRSTRSVVESPVYERTPPRRVRLFASPAGIIFVLINCIACVY